MLEALIIIYIILTIYLYIKHKRDYSSLESTKEELVQNLSLKETKISNLEKENKDLFYSGKKLQLRFDSKVGIIDKLNKRIENIEDSDLRKAKTIQRQIGIIDNLNEENEDLKNQNKNLLGDLKTFDKVITKQNKKLSFYGNIKNDWDKVQRALWHHKRYNKVGQIVCFQLANKFDLTHKFVNKMRLEAYNQLCKENEEEKK